MDSFSGSAGRMADRNREKTQPDHKRKTFRLNVAATTGTRGIEVERAPGVTRTPDPRIIRLSYGRKLPGILLPFVSNESRAAMSNISRWKGSGFHSRSRWL